MIISNPDTPFEELKAPPVPMKDTGDQHPTDEPPPYSPRPSSSRVQSPPPPQSGTPTSVFRPANAQTVNHFELFSKHDAISGTFLVDPRLPTPSLSIARRLRRKRDNVWGKSSTKTDINATFRTRHGAMNLDIEVVAQQPPQPGERVPARIIASSNHGRINIDVHDVQPGRSLDLHVETQHGKIVVLLPPTFEGPLVFNTRCSNSVQFLPAFAARTRTLRASDRETVVVCSASPSQPPVIPTKPINQMADDPSDRCLVRTKHGKVLVGISGLDRVEEPAPVGGFFKALGRLFETQGKAFGQYVETQAKNIEKMVDTHLDQAGAAASMGMGRGRGMGRPGARAQWGNGPCQGGWGPDPQGAPNQWGWRGGRGGWGNPPTQGTWSGQGSCGGRG